MRALWALVAFLPVLAACMAGCDGPISDLPSASGAGGVPTAGEGTGQGTDSDDLTPPQDGRDAGRSAMDAGAQEPDPNAEAGPDDDFDAGADGDAGDAG